MVNHSCGKKLLVSDSIESWPLGGVPHSNTLFIKENPVYIPLLFADLNLQCAPHLLSIPTNPSPSMFNFGLTDLQAAKKAPPPPSIAMDEDAQKRNTDCIYFLASPLTCKKVMLPHCNYSKLAFWVSVSLRLLAIQYQLTGNRLPKKIAVRNTGFASMGATSVVDWCCWVAHISSSLHVSEDFGRCCKLTPRFVQQGRNRGTLLHFKSQFWMRSASLLQFEAACCCVLSSVISDMKCSPEIEPLERSSTVKSSNFL